jgi:hypothetical protein
VRGPAGRPCGTVSNLEGGGQRSFGGSLDATERRVFVFRSAARRLMDLLFSKDGLIGPLIRSSGARCFTVDGLRRHVAEVLGAHGVHAALRVTPYEFPEGATLSDADGRMTRYREGCAIATAAEPGANDRTVVIAGRIKP